MKLWKICSGLLALAMAAVCVPAGNAQSIPVVAVGSSGFFGASALAAIKGDPIRSSGPLCGSRFWTAKVSAIDSRTTLTSPNLPPESANTWIAWDNDSTPTIICVYFAADSIVGQRLFFGTSSSGNATLLLPTNACSTPGSNLVSFIWDTATAGLPLPVYNALMGTTGSACPAAAAVTPVHFNVAFSDVRSEDAQFLGSNRILANDSNSTANYPTDDKSNLGFGPGVTAPGTSVVSSFSTSKANVSAYSYMGTDPISLVTVPQSQNVSIGEQAMLVFVNTTNTSSPGFGYLTSLGTNPLTNVNSHTLAMLYSGQAVLTRDIYGVSSAGLGGLGVHALVREPMSGTYTTFEWQVIRQRDANNALSQESGIAGPSQTSIYTSGCFVQSATAYPPSGSPCSNPVNTVLGSTGGLRARVIGTGQMIAIGNTASLPDSLGYAFWSLGNFGNKQNIKYLTLDGSDPLFPSYSLHNGVLPGGVTGQGTAAILPAPTAGQCGGYFNGDGGATITSFSCNAYTLPTFDGVQNGTYRLWNNIQAEYYGSSAQTPSFSPLNITGFILSAQNQTAPPTPTLTDFVPITYCGESTCNPANYKHAANSFRSHYAQASWGIGFPNNGVATPSAENGGDVAGSVLSRQIEQDSNSLFGSSLLSFVQ
jgi:hypothetical protein